jgi:hypothetical protein
MSVHQGEPINAGPDHSEEVKTAFLTWAREIQAIQRIDRDAATAAGFSNGKDAWTRQEVVTFHLLLSLLP